MRIIVRLLLVFIPTVSHGQEELVTVIQKGHGDVVKSAAISPDMNLLVTASGDKTAKLWSMKSGLEIRSFNGHAHTVNHVDFSADGQLLATTSTDKSAAIWEVTSGKQLFRFEASDFMTQAVFSPDIKYLVTGGYEKFVTIWDIDKQLSIDSIKVSPVGFGYGIDLTYSADGKWLAIGQDNQMVKVYETQSWQQVYEFPIEFGFCGNCIAFTDISADGQHLLKLTSKGTLYQYDLSNGSQINKWEAGWKNANCIDYSPDGESILIGTEQEVIILKATSGDTLLHFQPDVNQVNEARFSPDGLSIIVSGNHGMATLFNAKNGELITSFKGILNETDKGGLSYDPSSYWDSFIAKYVRLKNKQLTTPDGNHLIRAKFGNKAKTWNVNNGRVTMEFTGHEKTILGLDLTEDGKVLLTGGGDRHVRLWDTSNGSIIKTLTGHVNLIFESIFSNDETKILTSGWDALVNLWDIETGKVLARIDFVNTTAYTIAFTPNDLYFVAGKLDKTLEMYEFDTRQMVRTFIGHTDVVSQILFLEGGAKMVSAGWDGTARLWDVASGLMQRKFTVGPVVHTAVISRNENKLLTGSDDGKVIVWEIASGRMVNTFSGHQAGVTNLNFLKDESILVSTDLDGVTKFWDFATGNELFEHIHIGKSDWMVKTREGYFSATDGARKAIHFVRGNATYELDQFFNDFYRPDLIEDLLGSGSKRNFEGIRQKLESSPPPDVKLAALKSDDGLKANIFIKAVNNGGGLKDLKLFHNGKKLSIAENQWKSIKTDGNSTFYEHQIPLIGGVNLFEASASSEGSIESKRVSVEIESDLTPPNATCHILTIGINKYQNEKLNLNYATADARAITEIFNRNAQSLFGKIKVHSLFDGDATREGILNKMEELAGEVRLHDVFIFYYAGHGSVVDDNFYFIPYESSRLYDLKTLEKSAIRADIIQQKLEKIRALKQIIVMDACQSGGSVELLAQRGALEEKAIAQLSRSAGIHVLAAAGSDQFATEFTTLGHGIFTFVLLQALNGMADGAPKDGKVTIYELKSYLDDQVPEKSQEHKGKPQYPYTFSRGNDFPVVLNEN